MVLVADDVSTNQQVAMGILKMFGLRADAVASSETYLPLSVAGQT